MINHYFFWSSGWFSPSLSPIFFNWNGSIPSTHARLIPNIFKYKRPDTGEKVLVKISRINGVLIEVIGYLFLYTLIDIIYFILD